MVSGEEANDDRKSTWNRTRSPSPWHTKKLNELIRILIDSITRARPPEP